MRITWVGHACFIIEENGYRVVFDPYKDGSVPGCGPIREEADAVYCSHGHDDHSAKDVISVRNTAVRNPFTVTTFQTWHDPEQGKLRGSNLIHLLKGPSGSVIHFGDLGCRLNEDEIKALSGADVALIPVGGFFTIDGNEAAEIIHQIRPKLVIPMHFRGEGFGYDVISSVDPFLSHFDNVTVTGTSSIEYPGANGVAVLQPANVQG